MFDNRFRNELPGDTSAIARSRQVIGALWSDVTPTPVSAPQLIAYSPEVAAMLDLSATDLHSADWVNALSGNGVIAGMQPYATNYGGHQFGHWAGQLGDGRAIMLGERINARGARYELQLKGAGATPYSRTADGRAVLRSSIREFLCSEAMHHLGIPTTRALALVATGDAVVRDMFYDGHPEREPGAIVCRVSPSFTRFGHFELLAARHDHALLKQLVDFTMHRDFAQFSGSIGQWLEEICVRTARLMVDWMRVGFVHGVMNTDNMSILGLTIDYGPYGWIDNFDTNWTPNTTDAQGRRYAYGRQPAIAQWNLSCLAGALAPIANDDAGLSDALLAFDRTYHADLTAALAAKFGFARYEEGDAQLFNEMFALMERTELDMTEFFRALANVDVDTAFAVQRATLRSACYDVARYEAEAGAFSAWLTRYAARVRNDDRTPDARRDAMNAVNPRYVLRNYLAQEAIDLATQGDAARISELLNVLRHPYDEQPSLRRFAALRPDWAREKPGCSMLSCSS